MSGIEYMYKLFGKSPDGLSCKDCEHFMTIQANRRYFKCAVYGNTDSAASDWRKKYIACGLYNKAYNGTPIIEVKKHDKRPRADIVIDGQISLF